MARIIRIAGLTLAVLETAGAMDPVRRTNQKASPSDLHCVVWGDGPYYGMKFHSESDADERFKQAKREELVAVHYDKRFREVQRFQSRRVKAVRWHHLAEWCKENDNVEEPAMENQEIGVGAAGKVENFMAHAPAAASLLDADPADAVGIKSSSSLVGTVSSLEGELIVLAPKTSHLFNAIGQANPLSDLKLGSKDDKLKSRVNDLERYVSVLFASTRTLEEEIAGSVGSAPAKSQSWKEKVSIKGKVDTLLPKVEYLKRRILSLESSPVISGIGGLEGKIANFQARAASLTQSLGLEEGESVAQAELSTNSKSSLSVRIGSLERHISALQRSTNKLGYEMLERSFQESTASAKAGSLKVKVESLIAKVEDLSSRFEALEANSIKSAMDKLVEQVSTLHSKMMEVSKRIGSETLGNYKDTSGMTSTKARVSALEKYVVDAQKHVESVEVELLGGAKNFHESMEKTSSMKGRIRFVAVKVDGLLDRVSQLEHEV